MTVRYLHSLLLQVRTLIKIAFKLNLGIRFPIALRLEDGLSPEFHSKHPSHTKMDFLAIDLQQSFSVQVWDEVSIRKRS